MRPHRFDERIAKYGPLFKTSLMGAPTVVIMGQASNKFIFIARDDARAPQQPLTLSTIAGKQNISELSGSGRVIIIPQLRDINKSRTMTERKRNSMASEVPMQNRKLVIHDNGKVIMEDDVKELMGLNGEGLEVPCKGSEEEIEVIKREIGKSRVVLLSESKSSCSDEWKRFRETLLSLIPEEAIDPRYPVLNAEETSKYEKPFSYIDVDDPPEKGRKEEECEDEKPHNSG
ncbi:hypothetical protein CRG98_043415 [Punica granatum]|uniref:Uncharacterized protein n=1 Tax=Punica granatum TaxID=22663 RepID=A0A2I0HWW8_PUNGR|nr:hypothetical protein CRG98_043415 [Punica granatum]